MRSDTERLNWLEAQHGNLFTPSTSPHGSWAWFGNDGKSLAAPTLRSLLDALLGTPSQGTTEDSAK